MVRQIQQESETTSAVREPSPVAEVRVTPKDLLDALSSIEERQTAQADHAAGTVSLGEAIEQLGAAVTPEMLLAEIEAQRTASAKQQRETDNQNAAQSYERRTHRRRKNGGFFSLAKNSPGLHRLKLYGAGFSVLLNVFLCWQLALIKGRMEETVTSPSSAPIAPYVDPIVQASEEAVHRSGWNFANTKDDTLFYINLDEIYQLTHGDLPKNVHVLSVRGPMKSGTTQWLVTKNNGKFFIHGFSSGDANDALHDFSPVKISDDQHPLTLPLERLQVVRGPIGTVERYVRESTDMGDPVLGTVEILGIPAAKKPAPKRKL